MKRLILVLSLLVIALPGGLALDLTPASAEEDVVLELVDGMEMEQLLRQVAEVTHSPLIWDPADKQIRGKRVIGGLNIKAPRSKVFERVRALLTFYDLVIIPVGPQGYQMQLVTDARRTTAVLKLKARFVRLTDENLDVYEGADGLFITTTIQMEHMTDLRNARNALSRLVTGQAIGNVTEVVAANAFVVTDFAPNVVAIYRLLKEMDRPMPEAPSDKAFQSVNLQNANALEAAAVLSRLFTDSTPGGKGTPAHVRGPHIQADARTNAILVSGKAAEVEQVLQAVTVIDQEAPEPEIHAHMLRLAHMPAREAASALGQLIGSSRLLWRNPSDSRSMPVVVSLDRVNALLVSASNSAFEKIRRVVAEMDEAAREDAEGDEDGEDK